MTTTSFEKGTARIAAGTIAYRKAGSGPAVLHLHSAGGPRNSHVIDQLALAHTVYQPVVPGFDGTPVLEGVEGMAALADAFADFIRIEMGGMCDVVGESFGGRLALWLAIRHPDLVNQMVLESPAGLRSYASGETPSAEQEKARRIYLDPAKVPDDGRSDAARAENRRHAREVYGQGRLLDEEIASGLAAIKARVLVLVGTHEDESFVAGARRIKDNVSQSHITYIWQAAHGLEMDQPVRVARIVRDFLERGEGFLVPRKVA